MAFMMAAQKALIAARVRTGISTLGQTVGRDGRCQVVRVTYSKGGRSTVVPVTGWNDRAEHLKALENL